MEPFLSKTQKVKVTCILQSGDKILLLRSSQLADEKDRSKGTYFNLPSFTVGFGSDPKVTMEDYLQEYFDQPVKDLRVIDIRQYLNNNYTTQIFELIYSAKGIKKTKPEEYGRYLFVNKKDLDAYMFPDEITYLRRYL